MAAKGKFLCKDATVFWKAVEKGRGTHAYVPKLDKDLIHKPYIVDVDMVLTKEKYMSTLEFKTLYFDPLLMIVKKYFPRIECTVLRRPFLVKKPWK